MALFESSSDAVVSFAPTAGSSPSIRARNRCSDTGRRTSSQPRRRPPGLPPPPPRPARSAPGGAAARAPVRRAPGAPGGRPPDGGCSRWTSSSPKVEEDGAFTIASFRKRGGATRGRGGAAGVGGPLSAPRWRRSRRPHHHGRRRRRRLRELPDDPALRLHGGGDGRPHGARPLLVPKTSRPPIRTTCSSACRACPSNTSSPCDGRTAAASWAEITGHRLSRPRWAHRRHAGRGDGRFGPQSGSQESWWRPWTPPRTPRAPRAPSWPT